MKPVVILTVIINFIIKQGLLISSDPDPAVPDLSNDTADSTLATSDMSEVGIEPTSKGPEAASLSDPLSSSSSLVDISSFFLWCDLIKPPCATSYSVSKVNVW